MCQLHLYPGGDIQIIESINSWGYKRVAFRTPEFVNFWKLRLCSTRVRCNRQTNNGRQAVGHTCIRPKVTKGFRKDWKLRDCPIPCFDHGRSALLEPASLALPRAAWLCLVSLATKVQFANHTVRARFSAKELGEPVKTASS